MNTPPAPAGRPGSLLSLETSTALHKATPTAAANSVSQQCSAGAWSWCEKKVFLLEKQKFREKKSR
jgi:hypothetical protein